MKRSLLFRLVLAVAGISAAGGRACAAMPLFDGQTLRGWHGEAGIWSVDDGEIVGRSEGLDHNTFLVSDQVVEDFRLVLEVRLVGDRGNSGIQFRSEALPDGEVKGYQADIGPGWWGKLYHERGRGILSDRSAEAFVRQDDWNRYEIEAVGNRVRTWINGRLSTDVVDPPGERRGILALQVHSGEATEVRFRHLRLTILREAPVPILASTPASAGGSIRFARHQLDTKFRSEGVAVGDFNRDGRADIAAGSVWYAAPDWTVHSVLDAPLDFPPKEYSDSFCNFVEDINRDGWDDLLVVDFPGRPTWWFENPRKAGSAWPRHMCIPVTNNESPQLLDVDNDGTRELLCGTAPGNQIIRAVRGDDPPARWMVLPVSAPDAPGTDRFSHGLGAGDISGDGRPDVVITDGWWEAPGSQHNEPWTFHRTAFGPACAQMHIADFDGDGDADVLSSSAHSFGVWWHERTPEGFVQREIDTSFSQTHALCLADINGDGLPDFVTGKRWWAHGGKDPGADQPAVVHWFELKRQDGKPVWVRHPVDDDSGIGTQFEVADVNGDGLLDIVTANKKGVFYFEQRRSHSSPAVAGGGQ
jgi:hypothetical protein